MKLEDCLPAELQVPTTAITRIAAGLSGAGVYRVEAAAQVFVLKVAGDAESDADWKHALHIQRLAAEAALSPRVVHVDEARRAVLTSFVADRSFVTYYRSPESHLAALEQLGRTVRRIHALPLPADAHRRSPREFLTQLWSGLQGFALPPFAREAVQRVLAETPTPDERPLVLGHNDLNPSNLIYDGQSIVLLDWAATSAAEPFYDLATLAVFLRMDASTCLRLLSAYEGRPVAELPERFNANRRQVATLAGTMSLHLARKANHPGATGAETLEATLPLGEFYQRMRAGELRLGTPEGQWAFGLALLKEGLAV